MLHSGRVLGSEQSDEKVTGNSMKTLSGMFRRNAKTLVVLAVISLVTFAMANQASALPGKCVRHHVGGTFDGLTWATAYDNVQDAINASVSGDEIWVAAGEYSENIVLKSGVALYGGFAGTETLRTQRNWVTNVCVLSGRSAGSVIQIPQNATSSTRVDGFTITNGRAMVGGGIFCNHYASPVIINNVIRGNSADYEGGGIYCGYGGSPVIANNTISSNGAVVSGGGVCTKTGSPTLTNNIIGDNSARVGAGICCGDADTESAELIINNTIVANAALDGGGINCRALSSASISNNIVAFNSAGIRVESGTGSPVLTKNCVSRNDDYDYQGIGWVPTEVSTDPLLASLPYGNYHIQPSSPCRNAGSNSQVIAGYSDIDGQTRTQDGTVDIGADESDGTTWTVTPTIVRVATTGSDSNNGSSWAAPMRTIQAAINAATPPAVGGVAGGEVWVKAGTYAEQVVLRDHVHVYGGFAGTETALSQRNWTANVTTIDGQSAGPVVTAVQMGYRVGSIDGFRLQNGSSWNGAGVFCATAAPVIRNNTVTANTAGGNGAGIYVANSRALVEANQIINNTSLAYGGGVNCHYTKAQILRNNIEDNSAVFNGCGAFLSQIDASDLVNNRIVRNHANPSMGGAWGIGVSVDSYADPRMICNTVADNSTGSAIYAGVLGHLSMYSNIVALNSSGVSADTGATVYQTASYTSDPWFVNRSGGNYALQSGSPCIDAANAATAPYFDYAGNGRPVDGDGNGSRNADIGCYEYGTFVSQPPVAPTSASASPSSICTGASSTLHATGGSGSTLRWLVGGCDGSPIGTGNDLVVQPVFTTTYYARWVNGSGISTCASTTVTILTDGLVATVGGPQSISGFGTTEPLGGNTPTPPATGAWSVVSGGTGTFSNTTDPNATFTHTGGDGPIVLRWTVTGPPCDPAHADVTVTIGYFCLHNGNFDGGFTNGVGNGWQKASPTSGTFAEENTIKHSGVASQKITDGSGAPAYTCFLYKQVNVQPGKVYVPTFWMYRLNQTVARVGVDPNGGTSFVAGDLVPTSNTWVYKTHWAFTAGPSGLVSIGLAAGLQSGSGTIYYDDVAIKPQAPQSTSGTTTITLGNSATITASGGFGGASHELYWYTGPNGTGVLAGVGTPLIVFPTTTTTYYPRWETTGPCSISDDGAAVTVTVLPPAPAPTVTSVTPPSGPNTGAIGITNLAGTGFTTGAAVKLRKSGEADIVATGVSVASSTSITCSLDLTGRTIGLWDVVVSNTDGQSGVLANGFGVGISNTDPAVGTNIRSLLDQIAVPTALIRQFCVWGVVELIDGSTFWLEDATGARVKVFAPGHTGLVTGDFASACGTVDLSAEPPILVSASDRVVKHD